MAARRSRYALVAGLACAAVVMPPAHAAQAKKPFVPGNATAIAETVQLAPSTGGLSAAITVGTTIAQYRSSLAQASSQTLNLGVIGSTLTVQCDKNPPALRPDQLPQPLVAESDKGDSHAKLQTAGAPGSSGMSAVAGEEIVHAWTQPKSLATFHGSSVVVPGVLEISGLHATSTSTLIKKTSRTAAATAEIGEVKLLKGAIVLKGLRWNASQRTGKGAHRSGHFSIKGASVGGKSLPVSPPKLDATVKTINKTLAATGLHMDLPTKVVSQGRVTVMPLSVGIDKSKIGNATLNPLLTAVQPITNAVMTALVGVSCKIGSLLGAVDLIQSGFDGTGGLDLNLGGVSATSDGKIYGNPFGNQPPPASNNHHHQTTTHNGSSPPGTTGSSPPGSTGPTTTGTTPTGTTPGQGGSTESTSLSSSCATTSPADRPSCSRGNGLKVGLIALALLLAFAATDAVVLRIRRGAEQTS